MASLSPAPAHAAQPTSPHIQMVNGGDNSNTEFMIFETLALTGWHRRVFQSGSSSATQLHTATHNAQHNAEAVCIEHQHDTQPASSSLSVSEHQYSSYTVTDEFGGEVKWNSSTGRGSFQTQSRIGSQARCDGAASEHRLDVFFLMVRCDMSVMRTSWGKYSSQWDPAGVCAGLLTKNKYLFCGFLSPALTRDHLPPGLINPHTLGPGSPTWVWFTLGTHLNTCNTQGLVV